MVDHSELPAGEGRGPTGVEADRSVAAAGRCSSEDVELLDSIRSLSTLATGRLHLEDLLTCIATFALAAVPRTEGAGLMLLEDDGPDTVVATAPFVREVDDIQNMTGQGPCISAAAEGRTVRSASLGQDPRWPRFGALVARLGVHSVISLPLVTPTGVVGAISVYALAEHVFDERAAEMGEMFAGPAAITVQNGRVLAQARRLAAELQNALVTRAVIDQAVGILMSRSGLSDRQALNELRRRSQNEHGKLAAVAQRIIDDAVRRAREQVNKAAGSPDPWIAPAPDRGLSSPNTRAGGQASTESDPQLLAAGAKVVAIDGFRRREAGHGRRLQSDD